MAIPLIDQAVIDSWFPWLDLTNMAEGKRYLKVYHQTPLAGLKGAAGQPTNLTKVHEDKQGPDESPIAFLKQQYTPYNPNSKELEQ